MSRSLHTDPYRIRAERRTVAPYRRRGSEPRAWRRQARMAEDPSPTGGPSHQVRIRVGAPRPGFLHPAREADVRRLLAFFGPAVAYGLRRVEMRQAVDDRPGLLLAALVMPGVVVLYEQPSPPWVIPGRLDDASRQRLLRAGADVTPGPSMTRVDWSGPALRSLMLFDGLMHEIGHHMIQNCAGRAQVLRTADHERRADAFAEAARRAWSAGVAR